MDDYKPDENEEINGIKIDSLVDHMLNGRRQRNGNGEEENISEFDFDLVHTFFEAAAAENENLIDISNSYVNIKECIKFYCQYFQNPEKYICETSVEDFIEFFAAHDFIGFIAKGIYTDFNVDIIESSLYMLCNFLSISHKNPVCESEEINEELILRIFELVKNPNIIFSGEEDGVPDATISSLFKSSFGKMSSFQFNSIRSNGLECISQLIQTRPDTIEIIHGLNLIDVLIETSANDIFTNDTLSRTQLILCQLLRTAPEPFDIDIIVQFAVRYMDINFRPFAPALYLIYYVLKYAPLDESIQIAKELSSNSIGQRIVAQLCDRHIRNFEPLNRIIRQIVKKAPEEARPFVLGIQWQSVSSFTGMKDEEATMSQFILMRTLQVICERIEGAADSLLPAATYEFFFALFNRGAFGGRRAAVINFATIFGLLSPENVTVCIRHGLLDTIESLNDPEDAPLLESLLAMGAHALRSTAEGTKEGDDSRALLVADEFVPYALEAVDSDDSRLAESAMDFLDAAGVEY